MSDCTRRGFLETAAVAAGMAGSGPAEGAENQQERGRTEHAQDLPTFRFALEASKPKVTEGGTAREATVTQLPLSKGLAGVSMRLKPGGIRELHWHAVAAEWAFVIKGQVRTTVIAPGMVSETNDFGPGDVWYFPRGHGHMLQNVGSEECRFLLVFDNGAFSEFGTFSITDWVGHTPPDVLSRSLGLPASAFAQFPREELYIVAGRTPPRQIPPPHQQELRPAPSTHRYPLMDTEPHAAYGGSTERRATVNEFPISTTIAGVLLDLAPGAVREPHWHPNADEWFYVVSGRCKAGVFGSNGRAREEQFGSGDVGYVPRGYGHYIDNNGDEPARLVVAFNDGHYQEISLSSWLASNPEAVVADTFKVSDDLVKKLPTRRVFIGSKQGPTGDGNRESR